MSLRSDTECAPRMLYPDLGHFLRCQTDREPITPCRGRRANALPDGEAQRLKTVIEATIAEVFGVAAAELSRPSRGKAPVALARQAAMYLAHVSCGLSLTDVGLVFARDRTTVAHACAVIEDRRDDRIFDRTLELMEWIVPSLVGWGTIHRDLAA